MFPEECAHSKAILIRTPLPTPTAYICSWYICSFWSSFRSTHLQCVAKLGAGSFPRLHAVPVIHPQLIFLPPNVHIWKYIMSNFYLHKIFKLDGHVLHERIPSKVLFVLPLLAHLPGLSHIGPVGERLQKPTDVLVFGPGSTDGELLITLNDSPENTPTHTHTLSRRQNHYSAFVL